MSVCNISYRVFDEERDTRGIREHEAKVPRRDLDRKSGEEVGLVAKVMKT